MCVVYMSMPVSATVGTESPSRAVIEAVAEREGVEPVDLTVPLYEAIDPDALDTLLQESSMTSGASPRIEFTYDGYDVIVTATGLVQVSGAD